MIRFLMLAVFTALNMAVPCLVTHTWTTKVSVPGLASLPADNPVAVTGDYAIEVEKSLNPGDTSIHVAVGSIGFALIQSVVLNADKVAMEIFTNAADGSGGQHFSLAANKSIAWNNQIPNQANPITANITGFYLNNPGAVVGTFRAAFLLNS